MASQDKLNGLFSSVFSCSIWVTYVQYELHMFYMFHMLTQTFDLISNVSAHIVAEWPKVHFRMTSDICTVGHMDTSSGACFSAGRMGWVMSCPLDIWTCDLPGTWGPLSSRNRPERIWLGAKVVFQHAFTSPFVLFTTAQRAELPWPHWRAGALWSRRSTHHAPHIVKPKAFLLLLKDTLKPKSDAACHAHIYATPFRNGESLRCLWYRPLGV